MLTTLAAHRVCSYYHLRDDADNRRPKHHVERGGKGGGGGGGGAGAASTSSSSGNAYMHIQRKIAALLHLLEDGSEQYAATYDVPPQVSVSRSLDTSTYIDAALQRPDMQYSSCSSFAANIILQRFNAAQAARVVIITGRAMVALVTSVVHAHLQERLVGSAELRARAHGGASLPGGGTVVAPRPRWYDRLLDSAAAKIGTVQLAEGAYWSLRAAELRGRQSHRDVFDDSLEAIYDRMLTDAKAAR